ncbi:hypothetical protein HQ584_10310 [Patescibacteria group bacterium]|nr:hypothetical protein [Patescibacteria group bacterium]
MKLIENLSIVHMEDFLVDPFEWDVLISCGSFEERCIRSSEIFLEKKTKIHDSIIFNYKETDPKKKKEINIQQMRHNLAQLSQNVHVFNTDSVSNPRKGIRKFLTFLKEKDICLSNRKIVIDITVFTKAYFFLLFKVLQEKFAVYHFWITYTEPEKYGGKNPDTGEIILTEGVDRIESIPGFAGSSVNYKDSLIVVLGFEGKRSTEIFYAVNPKKTYAINGFPSYQPGWDNISIEANLRFLRESRAFDHLHLAPAIDPFETKKVVAQIAKEIKEKDQNSNLVIAPLGTKMQALGVLLYALQDETVKVIYPFPSIYKADYSYSFGRSWICKLDLQCI